MEDLDRAVEVRKGELDTSTVSDQDNVETEAPYLNLLSQAVSLKKSTESDSLRTGRWTNEETAYADFLVSEFDKGELPITQLSGSETIHNGAYSKRNNLFLRGRRIFAEHRRSIIPEAVSHACAYLIQIP